MKKEYNITGLDCGHCALTLEKYLQKVDGVISASINFSTSKLYLEIEDDKVLSTIKNINKTIKQVNPDVKISQGHDHSFDSTASQLDIILYCVGLVLGLIILFVKPIPTWLYFTMLITSLLLMGYKTYFKAIFQSIHLKLDENTLVTISIIGACALNESMEGLMVIALYTLGKMLESRAVNYSRKSISALINTQPEYAIILKDEREEKVKPEQVEVGDIIVVKPGEKIPVDGVIIDGNCNIDKRHLTGESIPVNVSVDDSVPSGSIVLDGVLKIKATSKYTDSTVSKILNLVSNATNKKSKTETFISRFSSYYTLGVIILSFVVWGITWAVLGNINTAIYRGLIFLVVSCPCAFAISVPLSYFSGIGRCSKQGILIKGSNYLDTCASIDEILLDKTGTLTTGEFEVVKVETTQGIKESELFEIVVAGEQNSLHPIAKAICGFYGKNSKCVAKNYHEVAGKGIEFEIKRNKYFVGRSLNSKGYTQVDVLKSDKLIGSIYLQDKIKSSSYVMVENLKKLNVSSMMLTGDNMSIAKKVCSDIGIDSYHAELMPQDKFNILEKEKSKGKTVAFVGDGINDAPALTLSDVGISMGIMGSQATIESSDVVIADDNLKRIPDLIKISKRTKKIVLENIIFAGVTKLTFLILGALGITGMLLAVFADVGVTLLAILNSLRVLTYKIKN
ncbi:MAG TPA: cadmium-translocating P-type ATPase [Clostridiales bacterium]|nr:cadmium-translocating P-type ATPase [Clostridiales bacterium]